MAAPAVAQTLGMVSAKGLSGASTTTAAIGTASSGTGSVVALLAMYMGTAPTSSLTLVDSAGNTYTPLSGMTFISGNLNQATIFLCAVPNPILATTTFTIGAGGGAHARYAMRVFKLDSRVIDSNVGASAWSSGSGVTVTSRTPSNSNDRLWFGINGIVSSGVTDTISSTGYTLVPTGTAVEGTSGGSSGANFTAKWGYKQVLASNVTQTFNGTLSAIQNYDAGVGAVEGFTAAVNQLVSVA